MREGRAAVNSEYSIEDGKFYIFGQQVTEQVFKEAVESNGGWYDPDRKLAGVSVKSRSNIMTEINRAVELLRSVDYHIYDTETLKRVTDNARAYGWEIGFRQIDPCAQVTSSRQNPFVKPDWDAEILEEARAFIVTAKDVPL